MDKLLVLEALTKIGVQGPRCVSVGICKNLEDILDVDYDHALCAGMALAPYFARWPENSGCNFYPVEGRPYSCADLWSLETEVGRKRHRLLAWLIHEITKEIAMSVQDDLKALDAPRKVLEAGRIIDEYQEAGMRPPRELVEYVQDWTNRNRGNNRYGK